MRLPLTINSTDFSAYANKYGYEISYEARAGVNGGQLLDGSTVLDIVAYKEIVTVPLNYMDADQVEALLSNVLAADVSATVWDAMRNEQRLAVFHPTLSSITFAFDKDGRKLFRDGATLTLAEK